MGPSPAEAMACGCAVVCTRIGGHLDYAVDGHSALLVEKENPGQLAEKILELIGDDDRRKEIAENGNRLIRQEFSWESSVNRLEDCFRKAQKKIVGHYPPYWEIWQNDHCGMTNFIPIFPLNLVVYPGEKLNLHIFEPRYKQLIRECHANGNPLGYLLCWITRSKRWAHWFKSGRS